MNVELIVGFHDMRSSRFALTGKIYLMNLKLNASENLSFFICLSDKSDFLKCFIITISSPVTQYTDSYLTMTKTKDIPPRVLTYPYLDPPTRISHVP